MRHLVGIALVICCLWTEADSRRHRRIKLHIGGIFPMSSDTRGWAGGQACLPAAQLALDDVNKNHNVLPGYELVLHGDTNDSRCQPGLAAKLMYQLIYTYPTKLMLLSGCSTETTIVAEAAYIWNLLVVGYGASSPALSDRKRFPTLFRTHPSATIHNPTRIKMFEKYNWKRIGIIHSTEEVFTTTADDLEEKLLKDENAIVLRQNFGNPADAVSNLQRQEARIIVGMFYEKQAREVLCQVYKKGLYGKRYVWFLIGWYSNTWYLPQNNENVNCSAAEMREAAQYHFTTEGLMRSYDKKPGISNKIFETFKHDLENKLKPSTWDDTKGTQEAPLAYDAIWAVALALNCTINELKRQGNRKWIENFTYQDVEMKNVMQRCMTDVRFSGVSGDVQFSLLGDRITVTQIEQLQGDEYVTIGYYSESSRSIEFNKSAKILFKGDKSPGDRKIVRDKWEVVSVYIYASLSFFAGVGIAIAIACIVFNYSFCYRKLIHLSQYQVNNLMLGGCVICFTAVFVTGLPMETSMNHRKTFSLLCHAKVTLLMYGFTLMYGSMFSKVWMVHRLGSLEDRDQAVPAWKFYIIVGVFAIIDTVIAMLWAVIDPLHRTEENLPDTESPVEDDDVTDNLKLEHCTSKNQYVWIGLVFTYKGLLLLFGLFLAYEIRNAKAKHINDSRFVGMAVYNVAILCLITGPVTLIIPSQPNASFGFLASTLLLCTFISMGLIFLPKVVHIVRVPGAVESHKLPSGASAGGSVSDAQLSKEEQDRLKRLLEENEDITRQIAEKDRRIMELRRRLESRSSQQHQQMLLKSPMDNLSPNDTSSMRGTSSNGQLNKTITPAITTEPVVMATKRSSQKGVTFGSAVVPAEPQPPATPADEVTIDLPLTSQTDSFIQTDDTDVLL